MKTELIIALLGMACIGSLAAFFVEWAKADEFKHKAQDEHESYLAALNLHNTTAEQFGIEQRYLESKCKFLEAYNERCLEVEIENRMIVEHERNDLQDRLSALRCPNNDHVWKDGICIKCGRSEQK